MAPFLNDIKAKFYLYFVFCFLYTSSLYIRLTFPHRLKQANFSWHHTSISISNAVLICVECVALFLGGMLAVFIVTVKSLLVVSFTSIITAIILFEVISHHDVKSQCNYISYFCEANVVGVTAFLILFGVYYGLSRFILVVLLLEQGGDDFVSCTLACYVYLFNLCVLASNFLNLVTIESYFYISMPLSLLGIALLLIGHWNSFYSLDSRQISFKSIIRRTLKPDTPLLYPNHETNLLRSFAKLGAIFISLISFGLCNSQVMIVSTVQMNKSSNSSQMNIMGKFGDADFRSYIINTLSTIIFISIIGIAWYSSSWFKKVYSNKMWKLIVAFGLIFASTLLVAVVDLIQNNSTNRYIATGNITLSKMSQVYIIPQIALNGIGDVLLITTSGKYMYLYSVQVLKHLSVAFLLGATGSGGLGDFISLIIHSFYSSNFRLHDPNISQYILFFTLSAILAISSLITVIFMWTLRFGYEQKNELLQSS